MAACLEAVRCAAELAVFGATALLAADIGWGLHWLAIFSVPALVGLNGFFVAAEFALVAVRKTRVEELVAQGVRGAHAVEAAITRLDATIAATQLGITLASLALGWVGEPALARLVEPVIALVAPASWVAGAAHTIAVTIAFLLITFMHVVFGELIPKTLALQAPDGVALWVARPLLLFSVASSPLVKVMNGTGNRILRWFGHEPASAEGLVHSVEELALLIEDSEEAGVLSPHQARFVQKVFHLSGKKVRDCMVPRDKMATLGLHLPPEDVLRAVREGSHTRMPVFDGDADNFVGIVNTKDLFHLFSLHGVVILEDAIYPPLYLAPDDNVADALQLFRQSRRFLALVREPDGKIIGLMTMEDVIEEIVGDIEDEHDRPTPKLRIRRRRPPAGPAASNNPAPPTG